MAYFFGPPCTYICIIWYCCCCCCECCLLWLAGVSCGIHIHQDGQLASPWSVCTGEVQGLWRHVAAVAVFCRHASWLPAVLWWGRIQSEHLTWWFGHLLNRIFQGGATWGRRGQYQYISHALVLTILTSVVLWLALPPPFNYGVAKRPLIPEEWILDFNGFVL